MKTETKNEHVVVFRLGHTLYALPVFDVREVRRFEPLVALPETPSYLAGVLHLRNHVLAVMDLGLRFGKTPVEPSSMSRILIVRAAGAWAGILVDEVRSVTTIPTHLLQNPPSAAQRPEDHHYLSAIAHVNEQLVLFLDVSTLFSAADVEAVHSHA